MEVYHINWDVYHLFTGAAEIATIHSRSLVMIRTNDWTNERTNEQTAFKQTKYDEMAKNTN